MYSKLGIGDLIAGKYRILGEVGSGGMGVVYRAKHERLDRLVAIKILRAQLDSAKMALARFEREVKAMASVTSPHVAHAIDADVLEDGSPYLVMEYLDGRDLRAERKLRGTIPYAEAVGYLIQACRGIAAVHDVGIIHRDIKPHNLFVTQLAGPRIVKVLDFGVAKFLAGADLTMTATDVAVGTPLYMSPEQLCSPKEVSQRSDVWALGVVLYELIAGVTPFSADSPGAVVAAVTLEEPIALHSIVPDIPIELSQIVVDALVKMPSARIASACELAERLAPFGMAADAVHESKMLSQRPVTSLSRASVRPELSALIRSEVDSFDDISAPPGAADVLDSLRRLPLLQRLSIPLTNPAAPIARNPSVRREHERPKVEQREGPVEEERASRLHIEVNSLPNPLSEALSRPFMEARRRATWPKAWGTLWTNWRVGAMLFAVGVVASSFPLLARFVISHERAATSASLASSPPLSTANPPNVAVPATPVGVTSSPLRASTATAQTNDSVSTGSTQVPAPKAPVQKRPAASKSTTAAPVAPPVPPDGKTLPLHL
jgi:serine/threonine-protein kinase